MSTEHELKCWPVFFEPVFAGLKTFELRKNDRDYGVGDLLRLREWVPSQGYTGRECTRVVSYLMRVEDLPWESRESGALAHSYVLVAIRETA